MPRLRPSREEESETRQQEGAAWLHFASTSKWLFKVFLEKLADRAFLWGGFEGIRSKKTVNLTVQRAVWLTGLNFLCTS